MGRVEEILKKTGTTFQLINTDVYGRSKRIEQVHPGEPLKLVRQPKNAQDPNTIVIKNQEGSLGLLPPEAAKELAPLFDEKKILYKAKAIRTFSAENIADKMEIVVEIKLKDREKEKEVEVQEKSQEKRLQSEKPSHETTVREGTEDVIEEKIEEEEKAFESPDSSQDIQEQETDDLSDDEIIRRAIAKERKLWEEEIEGYKNQLQILSKLQFIQRRKLNAEIALVKRQLKGLDMQEKNLRP